MGVWDYDMSLNFQIYGHKCDISSNLRSYMVTIISHIITILNNTVNSENKIMDFYNFTQDLLIIKQKVLSVALAAAGDFMPIFYTHEAENDTLI